MEAEKIARRDEQLEDIGGSIGKGIRRIIAAAYNSPVSTSIRLDQSAQKLFGVKCHDSMLPWLEHNETVVFPAGTMLREQRRPRLRVARHDHNLCVATATPTHPGMRQHCMNRSGDSFGNLALLNIEKNAQHIRLSAPRNIAIPEIHAEQVGVKGILVLVVGFEPTLD